MGSHDPKKIHVLELEIQERLCFSTRSPSSSLGAEICNSMENISCERVTLQSSLCAQRDLVAHHNHGAVKCPSSVGDLLGSWVHSHGQHSTSASFYQLFVASEKKRQLPNLFSQGAAYWKENRRTELILKMRNSWAFRELRGSQCDGWHRLYFSRQSLIGKCGSSFLEPFALWPVGRALGESYPCVSAASQENALSTNHHLNMGWGWGAAFTQYICKPGPWR